MAALLITTVVAPSSPNAFSALPEREGRAGAVDLSTSSRSSLGIEAGAGSNSLSGHSTRSGIRSSGVNYEKSSSNSGWRSISKDSTRARYANLSSKLTNDVNQSPSPMRRREEYHLTTVTDVIENVEFERLTVRETKPPKVTHEVHRATVSRIPQVPSIQQDLESPTKLVSIKDYMEQVPGFVKKDDTGPPRWFCPLNTAGYPSDAPILLFLPGMDSTGLGLLLHQRKLARLFEVQILHIPISDRTDFEGLLEIVEARIREEYDRKPSPIYIMAESFGCTLAFSVAARNPDLDLVLIIANPATSFERSPLQPLLPLLQWVPNEIFQFTPFLLSFTMGNPVKMASASVDRDLPPWERLPKVADAMAALLPTLPILADIMPREFLVWKLRLLNDGSRYANARLRYVKNEILLLASGNDQMIPSVDEAKRLKDLLPQIKARTFPNNGHTILLEDGVDVATLIKQTQMLRHRKNKKFDAVNDFRFPIQDEITRARSGSRLVHQIFSPMFFSTTENGKVRKGLPQLPKGRPLLFVSNHTVIGFDLGLVVEEVLVKKGVLLRGLAHPILNAESEEVGESSPTEVIKLFGSVPVNGANLYRLLARGEAALLYPGGVREAFKRKGEKYKLFWSETAEFVRTAIRHGATIIPFASVGGDDIIEIVLDSNDLLSLPIINEYVRQNASQIPAGRTTGKGEVTEQAFITPVGYPKPSPPRFYFMFGLPISTDGMLDSINDTAAVDKLYKKVKTDVESGLEYLLRKRKQDPYQDFLPRVVYEATHDRQAPTFDF